MKKRWKRTSSESKGDFSIFSVRYDHAISPETGFERDFTILEASDWVNIVAITPEREFVLVRQFRHGNREYTVEIPGGAIDRGDADPEEAARRELEEETGYCARLFKPIGVVDPNPAFQTNRCHTYLAVDAMPTGRMKLDPGEEIEVLLSSVDETRRFIREGVITHSLVIAAFFWLGTCENGQYSLI